MAFSALAKSGELTAKTRLSLTYGMFGSDQFETLLAHRKEIEGRDSMRRRLIFVDGVLESETAAPSPPLTHPNSKGSLTMPADALNAAVTRFDAMGLQVHMHAIGDAAVRAGLDAFAAARG
jgi:predicted amidohydrolase YtcJ